MKPGKSTTNNTYDAIDKLLRSDLDGLIASVAENGFSKNLEHRIDRSKKRRRRILVLTLLVGIVPFSIMLPKIFVFSTQAISELVSNSVAQSSFIPENTNIGLLAACLIFVSSLLITISDVLINTSDNNRTISENQIVRKLGNYHTNFSRRDG